MTFVVLATVLLANLPPLPVTSGPSDSAAIITNLGIAAVDVSMGGTSGFATDCAAT